jgi:predicted RNA-binding protein YlxR (DUF448 family)/ribosomal protein L7Ae-like RNA K-turn-binding protein
MSTPTNRPSPRKRDTKGTARRGSPRERARAEVAVGRVRTCAGCGNTAALGRVRKATSKLMGEESADPIVRIVIGPAGEIAVDAGQHGDNGEHGFRGAYVHANVACVKGAAQRGLSRAAKAAALLDGQPVTLASLAAAICDAYRRRAQGLLVAAKRARSLAVGSDAVTMSCREGEGHLVVVAVDAGQAADLTEVRRAVADGRAVAWPSKASLGEVVRGGPTESGVGVVAITDTRIAGAMRESLGIVAGLEPAGRVGSGGSSPRDGASGSEVSGSTSGRDEPASGVSEPDLGGTPGHGVASGAVDCTAAHASIVHGWAATLRGSDDPRCVDGAFRVVEWSA